MEISECYALMNILRKWNFDFDVVGWEVSSLSMDATFEPVIINFLNKLNHVVFLVKMRECFKI